MKISVSSNFGSGAFRGNPSLSSPTTRPYTSPHISPHISTHLAVIASMPSIYCRSIARKTLQRREQREQKERSRKSREERGKRRERESWRKRKTRDGEERRCERLYEAERGCEERVETAANERNKINCTALRKMTHKLGANLFR